MHWLAIFALGFLFVGCAANEENIRQQIDPQYNRDIQIGKKSWRIRYHQPIHVEKLLIFLDQPTPTNHTYYLFVDRDQMIYTIRYDGRTKSDPKTNQPIDQKSNKFCLSLNRKVSEFSIEPVQPKEIQAAFRLVAIRSDSPDCYTDY